MGVNVQEEICNNGCPLRFSCGFQRQATVLRNDPLGLFVMAADYLWLPCPAPRADMVIVDESVIAKATETISFDPARIVDDQKWAARDLDDAMAFRATALLVRAAVVEHPGRELSFLRSCDVTDRALKECIDHLFSKEEAKATVNGSMTDKQIAGILDAVEAREILKVIKLFRQVRREFAQPRDRLNSVWFDPDRPVMVDGQLERQPRVVVSYVRPLRIRKEVPILCLDGTGSIDLNRKIFGDHMTLERFAVPRDAEVYQVTSKTFSRQSITGTDHKGNPRSAKNVTEAASLRAQVVEFLSILPGNVLLVSYKAAIEALIDDLPPHVATAHFGALRGLNSFEHCETVVVMGREQPSAQAIEALTRPFCADRSRAVPAGRRVRACRPEAGACATPRPQPGRGSGPFRCALPDHAGADPRGRDGPGDRPRAARLQPPQDLRPEQPATGSDRRPRHDVAGASAGQIRARIRARRRASSLSVRPCPLFPRPLAGRSHLGDVPVPVPRERAGTARTGWW